MIGSVGLYLLFAMLFLFYYYADAVVNEDKNENNDAQDVEEASSTKADKDAQDDAGDVNEFGRTIIRKKKIRSLGTSMRRILVNQVSSSSYSTLMYFCVYSF